MKQFENTTGSFSYLLKKSSRKTVSIIIEPDCSVRVLVPSKMNQHAIEALLEKKSSWIIHNLHILNQRKVVDLSFESGESILYLGEVHVLNIIVVHHKKEQKIHISNNRINIYTIKEDSEYVKNQLNIWFRLRAEEIINERTAFYASIMGTIPDKVIVKTQTKRWGSCTSKRHVFFNWRLVFAPIEVLDYVVIHELCHLVHMNHSKAFWHLVEMHDANYKTHKGWLKENGQRLFQI